jgi:hypothetical protein
MGIEQALKDFASSNAGSGALAGAGIGGLSNALRAYLAGDSALEGGLTGAALGGIAGGGLGYTLGEGTPLENYRKGRDEAKNLGKAVAIPPKERSNTTGKSIISNTLKDVGKGALGGSALGFGIGAMNNYLTRWDTGLSDKKLKSHWLFKDEYKNNKRKSAGGGAIWGATLYPIIKALVRSSNNATETAYK